MVLTRSRAKAAAAAPATPLPRSPPPPPPPPLVIPLRLSSPPPRQPRSWSWPLDSADYRSRAGSSSGSSLRTPSSSDDASDPGDDPQDESDGHEPEVAGLPPRPNYRPSLLHWRLLGIILVALALFISTFIFRPPELSVLPPCQVWGNPNGIPPRGQRLSVSRALQPASSLLHDILGGRMTEVDPKADMFDIRGLFENDPRLESAYYKLIALAAETKGARIVLREDYVQYLTKRLGVPEGYSQYRDSLVTELACGRSIWSRFRPGCQFRPSVDHLHRSFVELLKVINSELGPQFVASLNTPELRIHDASYTCLGPVRRMLYSTLWDIPRIEPIGPEYKPLLRYLRTLETDTIVLDGALFIAARQINVLRQLIPTYRRFLVAKLARRFNLPASSSSGAWSLGQIVGGLSKTQLPRLGDGDAMLLYKEILDDYFTLFPALLNQAGRMVIRESLRQWNVEKFEHTILERDTSPEPNRSTFVSTGTSVGCSTHRSAFLRWWFDEWTEGGELRPDLLYAPDMFFHLTNGKRLHRLDQKEKRHHHGIRADGTFGAIDPESEYVVFYVDTRE